VRFWVGSVRDGSRRGRGEDIAMGMGISLETYCEEAGIGLGRAVMDY
jgi:hypothetical protein